MKKPNPHIARRQSLLTTRARLVGRSRRRAQKEGTGWLSLAESGGASWLGFGGWARGSAGDSFATQAAALEFPIPAPAPFEAIPTPFVFPDVGEPVRRERPRERLSFTDALRKVLRAILYFGRDTSRHSV